MFKNIPVIGVIYNPFIDKIYYSLERMGDYCNSRNIDEVEEIIPEILLDNTYKNCNMKVVKLIASEARCKHMSENDLFYGKKLYKSL